MFAHTPSLLITDPKYNTVPSMIEELEAIKADRGLKPTSVTEDTNLPDISRTFRNSGRSARATLMMRSQI